MWLVTSLESNFTFSVTLTEVINKCEFQDLQQIQEHPPRFEKRPPFENSIECYPVLMQKIKSLKKNFIRMTFKTILSIQMNFLRTRVIELRSLVISLEIIEPASPIKSNELIIPKST